MSEERRNKLRSQKVRTRRNEIEGRNSRRRKR
jgi:hypothetical protein